MVIISRVASRIPFHDKWSIDYLYANFVKLSFWERLKYTYLKLTRPLCITISRALYQRTHYARDACLFSELDKSRIKDYYRQGNEEFWRQNNLLDMEILMREIRK